VLCAEGTAKQARGLKGQGNAEGIPGRAKSNTALRLQTKRRQMPGIQGFESQIHLLKNQELEGVDFIAKRNELSIKVDYLSMVFVTIEARELIQRILGLPFEFFNRQETRVKHQAYTSLYQCGSIKVFADISPSEANPLGLGCYLVLSGKGCGDYQDCFSMQGKYEHTYGDFFRKCRRLLGEEAFHLTRLDIAVDDKNKVPYFTIEQIKRKCLKDEFISKSRSYRFAESSFVEGTAKTVYIGDGKSNLSYRFYDKDKEQSGKYEIPYEEMGSWKRTELQLRDEVAHQFALLFAEKPEDLGCLTFDLLGSSLRFVTPDKMQMNKSRWKTSQFWERFLGAVKPLKIKWEHPENSLYETQRWLKEGGALSAVKVFLFLQENEALGDLEELGGLMNRIQYSHALSQKLVAHLKQVGREDLIPLVYEDTKKELSYG